MQPVKHWFSLPPLDSALLTVHGIGIHEPMQPGIVDRPTGTGDHLFMFFHHPVLLRPGTGTPGRQCRQPSRTMIIWQPGQAQCYGHTRAYTHSWIHCDGAAIRRILAETGLPAAAPFRLPDRQSVIRHLQAIYNELTGMQKPDRVIVENIFENWLRSLARVIDPIQQGNHVPRRLLELKHHIERNYPQRFTLAGLAGLAHMSIPHLCAEFRRHFKMPVMEYALRLRMDQAVYLLRDHNLDITEIARRVGYRDLFYFSRLFKKRFGISPTAMRGRLG